MSVTLASAEVFSRFVSELPGDPEEGPRRRQVHGALYSRVEPTPVRDPRLVVLVPEVAALLGLDPAATPAYAQVLGGCALVKGMDPYAACYGGHQFGNWAGQLGDGRVINLGELRGADGALWELQLKGAGPTPYSRGADGRAVLRSSVRELVCSEAMHHLGVPTTRALSLVTTGEPVMRDMFYDGNPAPEPGAIVCRVAPSFLRFGNFELPASRGDEDTLRALVRFTLKHFYPHRIAGEVMDVGGFFADVAERTAAMVVGWMRVGFVHGVMNTDNLSVLGLTMDYGPYGWIEPYDPGWTPNTTDAQGRRYRFGNQPTITRWNLLQLARALAPLMDDVAPLERTLAGYGDALNDALRAMMLGKLGLPVDPSRAEADQALVDGLTAALGRAEVDMTRFFRALAAVPVDTLGGAPTQHLVRLRESLYDPDGQAARLEALGEWVEVYLARVRDAGIADGARRAAMDAVNPLYVPRNYLLHEVIEALDGGDAGPLTALMETLRRPYTPQPGAERWAALRPVWARSKPGCSMLSCSS